MSIIKRKKQDKFFMMDNAAVQNNLASLNSIGLLAYITSLPADWQLIKTNLYNKFTRKTVDAAWKELIEKKYVAGFSAYVDRKKQYYYIASDEELTEKDFNDFVEETFFEVFEELNFIPKNLQIIKDNQFSITFNFKDEIAKLEEQTLANSSDVPLVQHLEYSTTSTVLKEQIQNKDIQSTNKQINNNKEIKNVNIRKLRNYSYSDKDFSNLCDLIFEGLFVKYNSGIFDKNQWQHVCSQLKFEMKRDKVQTSDLYSYLESSIKIICNRRKKKLGIKEEKEDITFYNWLER